MFLPSSINLFELFHLGGDGGAGAEVPYQQQQPFSNPEDRPAPGMGGNDFSQPPTY